MNRKQRRAVEKEARRLGNDDLADKTRLMMSMPEACSACDKDFDKKDKEQVATWSVVVREEKNVVRLYCPDCWNMAKDFAKSVSEVNDRRKENAQD